MVYSTSQAEAIFTAKGRQETQKNAMMLRSSLCIVHVHADQRITTLPRTPDRHPTQDDIVVDLTVRSFPLSAELKKFCSCEEHSLIFVLFFFLISKAKEELKSLMDKSNVSGVKGLADMDKKLNKLSKRITEVEGNIGKLEKVSSCIELYFSHILFAFPS